MAQTTLTIEELRTMPLAELQRERTMRRMAVAKMRIGIELKKEKDTAAYRREKRVLAQMETVLTDKMQKNQTMQKKDSSESSASSASSSSKKSPKSLPKAKNSTTLPRL